MIPGIRAVIFDIYGTLLLSPAGGVRADSAADPKLRKVLESFGHPAPASPSAELARLVRSHHSLSSEAHPEIDLRILWREVLKLPAAEAVDALVAATEAVWHPAQWMPGAPEMLLRMHNSEFELGLLSNAQCNSLASLADCQPHFTGDLVILSYQQGRAKPAPLLFELMKSRLATRGIDPRQTLFIGNDPAHDIVPANATGFRTALFAGHPASSRPGHCTPDFILKHWDELARS